MFNYNFQIFKLLLILLFISLVAGWLFANRMRFFNLFFGLFIAIFALFASRNIALFGLVSLVLISTGINQAIIFLKDHLIGFVPQLVNLKKQFFLYLLVTSLILVSIFLAIDYAGRNNFVKGEFGLGLRFGSEDSFKFFKEAGIVGPIFNNYDSGSALIFGLAGQEKVFVDNRPEAYSSQFFTTIYLPMQDDEQQWEKYLNQYNFTTIYFSYSDATPWGQKFLARILQDQSWSLIYFDNYYVILSRRLNTSSEILNKYSISDQAFRQKLRQLADSADFDSQFNLADLAQNLGHSDLAEEIYHQILISTPQNHEVILSLAQLYASSSNSESLSKSINYFLRAIDNNHRIPGIYSRLALVYWSLHDYETAENYWRQAKKINRHDADAVYYLQQVDNLKYRGLLPLN